MNWKGIVAIVLLVGLGIGAGVWWGSKQGAEAVMRKDAERVVEIARLHEIADKHHAKATTLSAELETAYQSVEAARDAADKARRDAQAARRQRDARVAPTTLEGCKGELGKCDATVAKLDLTVARLDDTIFAQDSAIKLCEQRDIERRGEIEGCTKAGVIQEKRVQTWQQQTKRGRVKTAFFGIGMAAAGGAVGYVAGRYTQ